MLENFSAHFDWFSHVPTHVPGWPDEFFENVAQNVAQHDFFVEINA
jgi:hypothetical protein